MGPFQTQSLKQSLALGFLLAGAFTLFGPLPTRLLDISSTEVASGTSPKAFEPLVLASISVILQLLSPHASTWGDRVFALLCYAGSIFIIMTSLSRCFDL